MAVHQLVRSFGQRIRRMFGLRGAAALMIIASATMNADLQGQMSADARFQLGPKVGLAMPAGALGDYTSAGPTAGLRIGYEFRPGVALIADGSIDFLKGVDLLPGVPHTLSTPDMKLQRYIAGVETRVANEDVAPWSVGASIGAGASRFGSDPYRIPADTQDRKFEYTAFTATGGVELGYALGRRLELVADGRLFWSMMDEDRTAELADLRRGRLEPFNSAWTVPFSVSVRTRI